MSLQGNVAGQTLVGSINKCDLLTISAYGIAVKNGFEGTEEEWLAFLKGDKGDKGEKGDFGYVEGEPITAEMVGARPNTWTPTAEEVGARPNTWLPTIAEIGAAPSGFGLGGMGKENNSFNNTIASGFYSMSGGSCADNPEPKTAFNYGNLFVINRYDALITQFLSYQGIHAVRHSTDGGSTWSPVDYINPPMVPGVEYRTTERWNGKAVYTKLCAYSPSSFTTNILDFPTDATWTEAISANVRWYCATDTSWRNFTSIYYEKLAEWAGQVYFFSTSRLVFELGSAILAAMNGSTKDIFVTLKYVKD